MNIEEINNSKEYTSELKFLKNQVAVRSIHRSSAVITLALEISYHLKAVSQLQLANQLMIGTQITQGEY